MGSEKTFYVNEYAYPLNTLHKNQIMQTVLKWARANNIFGLGRWGNISTITLMLQLKEH